MNKLYPLALLATSLLIHGAQAQTYTAERSGNWHVDSGPNVWDVSGEPPTNCSGCTITIKSGVTITMNAHITLSNSSILQVGTDGSSATALVINASGGTDFGTSYNIVLLNDGTSNKLKMNDGLSFLNASGAGTYDGLLSLYAPNNYYKLLGNAPSGFIGTTVTSNAPAAYGKTLTGPTTLNGTGTLPIGLTDFEAVVNNGAVDLTWITQFEQNSSHFDIERSSNGGAKWDVIGKVAAKGISALPVNYSFTDAGPGSGTIQYRIHGYDLDGKSILSPIQVIRTTPLANITVFPNPAKDYVNVSLPAEEATTGTVSIRLISQSGQLLVERRVTGAGGTIISFPVSSYTPGNYLVQVVTADGARQVSKVLISKQ
jgi:hypothetical protein